MPKKEYILVLGSGKSILDFSLEDKQILDECFIKLAINKFSAFYEKAGIKPTHIYFEDVHDESSILMLKHIFKLFRRKKNKTTFIISELYKDQLYKEYFVYIFIKTIHHFKVFFNLILVKLARNTLKLISVNMFNKYVFHLAKFLKTKPFLLYNLVPKKSIIQFIKVKHCEIKEDFWASSLKDPLYHFKGSFSSVLNYISICFPNKIILLAGVDFDSPDYFFEEELNKLNFNTRDWTYNLRKKHNKHFSIIETDGVKIDDALPFMLKKLKETNNKIYSLNKKSYLVKKGFVEKINVEDI
ncbi:hypothetical protein Q4Q34_01175 [Flavivirga abyssicola]|uniref:hypothetical protein n=1 Tax=Flavivirga abyssicola TaxID=3063533 RepID=UPI0026DFFC36|nr:hypothetical protein [Flavivirga sp. MEBiC07777]WVK13650.1 hypothetical protein Q4Q34_01175 [Flavivirga sp. MEBiC07777]